MTNLTTNIEQRDEIVTKLGGYAVVRDLAVRVLHEQTEAVKGSETYRESADRLRSAAAVAEGLQSADEIMIGQKFGAVLETSREREEHAARLLVHTLDSSGEIVRAYLVEALRVTDADPNAAGGPGDPFDAWVRANLEAKSVDPATAAEVVENTYGAGR